MREVQVSEAQGRLNELLGEVERGESVVITREGRPIARLVPEHQGNEGRAPSDDAEEEFSRAGAEAGQKSEDDVLAKATGHGSSKDVFDQIKQIRNGMPRITLEEILAWRHEGHHR